MLIALIVVAVIAVMAFGILGFVFLGKIEHDRNKAEANAVGALDALFDGSPNVTFSGHMRSMKYDTVVRGAQERGYKVAHTAGEPNKAFTLIFEKV